MYYTDILERRRWHRQQLRNSERTVRPMSRWTYAWSSPVGPKKGWVDAYTRSHAKSIVKAELGLSRGTRLPAEVIVEKVGTVNG